MINKLNLMQKIKHTKLCVFSALLFLVLSGNMLSAQSFLPTDQAISVLETEIQDQNVYLQNLSPSVSDYKTLYVRTETRLESMDSVLSYLNSLPSAAPTGSLPSGLTLVTQSLDESVLKELVVINSHKTAAPITLPMYDSGDYGTAENANLRNYLFALLTN